ncbi:hypothetical protein D3C78_1530900 [compost metagenome]
MSSMFSASVTALRTSSLEESPSLVLNTKTGKPKGFSISGCDAADDFTLSKDSTGMEST